MQKRKIIIIVSVFLFIALALSFYSRKSSLQNFSAWLWDAPNVFTEDELRKMFQIAKEEQIKTVYVRVDDYIDLYGATEGPEKALAIKHLDQANEKFINLAKEYDIAVEALGGDTTWAEPEERIYPELLFDAVVAYNEKYPRARFAGIQFDVEVNNSPAYRKDKTLALTHYLEFVEEIIEKKEGNSITKGGRFSLGFAIPFWYDNQNNNGVVLDWKEVASEPVVYHLFRMLNEISGGYLVLMDYRNYAEGRDGSIDNAMDEIEYASKNARNVKVVVGQETTDVLPAKITFHDTGKEYFKKETSKIIQAFRPYSVFAGVAIHHLPSYIDL